MTHLAIYNLEQHTVEHKEKYSDDEKTDDGYNAANHNAWRLSIECVGRGTMDGAWQLYRGKVAFDWKLVEPQKDKAASE